MIVPSASRTGLFLIGPRIPSGKRRASPHVRPSSFDVRIIPHHARGFGPTLKKSASSPLRSSNSTGFQVGKRVPSGCVPVATSTGDVHLPATRRDTQMPTSFAPSRVPPNQAATRPSRVSAIVDACALANGADSNTNSTIVGSSAIAVICDETKPTASRDAAMQARARRQVAMVRQPPWRAFYPDTRSFHFGRLLSATPHELHVEQRFLEGGREVPCTKAFNDLRIRELIAEPLSLWIARSRERLEAGRHHVQPGHHEDEVSLRRLQPAAG